MGRDPTHAPYHIYGLLPNTHQFYSKETTLSFIHMVSWDSNMINSYPSTPYHFFTTRMTLIGATHMWISTDINNNIE